MNYRRSRRGRSNHTPKSILESGLREDNQDPSLNYDRGLEFMKGLDITSAIRHFRIAYNQDRKNPDYTGMLGQALVAFHLDSGGGKFKRGLGMKYKTDSKSVQERETGLKEAVALLMNSLRLDEESIDDRYALARALLELEGEENKNKAIKHLRRIIHTKRGHFAARTSLVLAYMKDGDSFNAHQTLEDLVTIIEKDIPQVARSELPSKVLGTLARITQPRIYPLQFGGKHGVVDVMPSPDDLADNLVAKWYDIEDLLAAEIEMENANVLHRSQQRFVMHHGGFTQRLYFPELFLLQRPGSSNVFLVRRKAPSRNMAKIVEKAIDEGPRTVTRKWLTEYAHTIHEHATRILPEEGYQLIDVRELESSMEISGEKYVVGYYTDRMFTKFVDRFEEIMGVTLSDGDRRYFMEQFEEVNKVLNSGPNFLYSFYSDLNLPNILLARAPEDETPISGLTATGISRYINGSIAIKTDLENRYAWASPIDLCTAIEHEAFSVVKDRRASKRGIKRNGVNTNYFYLYSLILKLTSILEEGGQRRRDLRPYRNITPLGATPRQKSAKIGIYHDARKALEEYHARFGGTTEKFTIEDYRTFCLTASFHRHLTWTGDKLKEIKTHMKLLEDIRRDHPQVSGYVNKVESQLTEKRETIRRNAIEDLRVKTRRTDYDDSLELYITREMELEDSERALLHHASLALSRLAKLGNYGLIGKLNEIYHLVGENGRISITSEQLRNR